MELNECWFRKIYLYTFKVAFVRACFRVSFSSLWPAFTLTAHINAKVFSDRNNIQMELIRLRKKNRLYCGWNISSWTTIYEIRLIAIREVSPPFGEALWSNKGFRLPYNITLYFRGRKFSRKVNFKYFREKIFSRIHCSREILSSRENIFLRFVFVPEICRLVGHTP